MLEATGANRSLALRHLPMLVLRLHCRFADEAPSPAHAGEMWRGVVKEGLRQQSPELLAALFEPERYRASQPASGEPAAPAKTNTLTPGLALRVAQAPDDARNNVNTHHLELSFFGRAAPYAQPLLYGLLAQGEGGIGNSGLRFGIETVESRSALGQWQAWALPAKASSITALPMVPAIAFNPLPEEGGSSTSRNAGNDNELQTLALALTSRLRLKVNHNLLRRQPPLALLVERLISRANLLGTLWGDGLVVDTDTAAGLMALAERAAQLPGRQANLARRRVSSGRQETDYPGDGLTGVLAYQLPAHAARALLPLLTFGELTHLGDQTTMGSGHFRVLVSG